MHEQILDNTWVDLIRKEMYQKMVDNLVKDFIIYKEEEKEYKTMKEINNGN